MRSRLPLLAMLAALLASCVEFSPVEPEEVGAMCTMPSASLSSEVGSGVPLDSIFAAAGAEFGVPAELLKAIGYVETRWQMVEGHSEFPGQPEAFGIMALKGERLRLGAELAGVRSEDVRYRPEANIRAAAALLRHYAETLGIRSTDPGAWAPAVAEYSGITLSDGRAAYVHDDVYAILQQGIGTEAAVPGSDLTLAPQSVRPDFPIVPRAAAGAVAADFSGALWRASPNFNARPAGEIGRLAMVVIHTCEGSYTGCWSWLANPDSRVSAHYVVREDGSEITQLVREADRGWHIGSNYDCALNQGFDCWRNGQSNNHFTIGIEHAGYASQTVWSAAQLDASARLVCDLTRRHGIARDELRIVGHAQLQPHNRSDPGRNWPWAQFYSRIAAHCGDTASGTLIVDSNNGLNDLSRGRIEVSNGWIATSATPGYYGSGYYFAPTGSVADPAVFRFYLPEPARHSIDAWWTEGGNRSPRATFHAVDAGGRQLGSVRADQQAGGSRWNTLGTWHFPAGWNSIQLSREGPSGCVVIADAIRVR